MSLPTTMPSNGVQPLTSSRRTTEGLSIDAPAVDAVVGKPSLLERAWGIKDSFALNFGFVLAWSLIVNRESLLVPSSTEQHYLLHMAKLWNADVLPSDWTFSTLPSHFFFNLVFGPLTLLFPLEVVGWVGRLLSSSLIVMMLFQLGRHFRVPLWAVTVSIFFWLLYGQSIVAGEWILATFEAKSIAYVFLLLALNGFLRRNGTVIPSLFLGLAFSFHPLVGFWGALAIGLTLIVLRFPARRLVTSGLCTAVSGFPGLIALLAASFETGPEASEALRFVSLVVMPYHLDPFFWGLWQPLLLLALMLGFNMLHVRLDAENSPLRFLIAFQMFLGLFFAAGFAARYAELYGLLLLMPCRLFPVLLPLFFFFHLMSALFRCHSIRYGRALMVLGFVALASYGSPGDLVVDGMRRNYRQWLQKDDDVQKAFRWIASHTPTDAVIVSPPWRSDSFYLSRRAQIAAWSVPRFDRLVEWQRRLELLVGDTSELKGYGTRRQRTEDMTAHYNALTTADLEALMTAYGATHLVTSASYGYPTPFTAGVYKIYELRRADAPGEYR